MIRRAWALLSAVPILVGTCVVVGWLTGSPLLAALNVNYFSIQFSAAAGFLIAGIGLLLYIYPSEFTRDAQMIIGLLLLGYAALSVGQDLFNIDLHLDEVTMAPGVTSFYQHTGRIAPNTALGFMLIGAIYILMPFTSVRFLGMLVESFIFFLILISVLALLGRYWRIDFLYSWANYRAMSLVTAVCFAVISVAISGIWRGKSASVKLYQGREDARIIMLSSAILLCMALAITIANFSSLISQQKDVIGTTFERLQKSRAIFFQNEIVQAIQEMNVIRDSQLFRNEMARNANVVSFADFDPLLKLFTAEGFSAVSIYDDKGSQMGTTGKFIQQAEFNVKEQIHNGYLNVLWKDGWYVQIATDVNIDNKKTGYIVAEWPLKNLDKVFSATQMMGATGDIIICMPAEKMNITCYSSRTQTLSTSPGKVGNTELPATAALAGQTGLVTKEDQQNRQVLAAYGPIGVLHLSMVVQMSVPEIYAPITKSLRTIIPAIFLTILVGLVLLRLQAMPLLRRVIQAEHGLMNSNARLEESEKRYALAIRGSSTGLWDWDFVKDTIFYSPYFKGMLGYTDAEFPNTLDSFKKALHPDDYARVFEHLEQHLRNQVPFDIEYRLRRKTGDYHWFLARGLALWDTDGNALRMVGSLFDVTERKRTEQRLSAQYAVIRLLSSAANLEDILGKIVQALCENLEWDFGAAWLVDNRAAVIRCMAVWNQAIDGIQALVDVKQKAAFPMGVGLAGRVWETGEHLWVFDLATDKNFPFAKEAAEAGLHSAFCFPIRVQNKVFGMLEFMMRQRQSPDEAMLKMMAAITTQIGQFAERKATESRLREMEKLKSELVANGSLALTSPSMPIRSASDPLPQGVMSPPVSPDEATVIVDWLDKPVDFNKLLKSIEKVSLAKQKPIPHILHIDNDREARRIIATFLQEFATVEEADTLAIAREKITNEKFDLVLLDFLLPDGNGAELLALLAKQRLPVILFSAVELDQEYARYFHEAQAKPGLLSESLVAQLKSMRAFLR